MNFPQNLKSNKACRKTYALPMVNSWNSKEN